jgi:hypothetical protein
LIFVEFQLFIFLFNFLSLINHMVLLQRLYFYLHLLIQV